MKPTSNLMHFKTDLSFAIDFCQQEACPRVYVLCMLTDHLLSDFLYHTLLRIKTHNIYSCFIYLFVSIKLTESKANAENLIEIADNRVFGMTQLPFNSISTRGRTHTGICGLWNTIHIT